MKRLVVLAVLLCVATAAAADDAPTLDTTKQKFSYGVGLRVAQMLYSQGIAPNIDVDAMALALKDLMAGQSPRVSNDEIEAATIAYQEELIAMREQAAEEARQIGASFLAENATRDGVETTESGLQYAVRTAGDGASPRADDTVVVHYRGKLLDGTEFDSSHNRGAPATFQVGQVIAGWQEAIQLMKPGAVWEVWIPAELAYGAHGAGGVIGPNETLHFEIELLEVQPAG